MQGSSAVRVVLVLGSAALVLAPLGAGATTGLYLDAWGARSAGMAGANLASGDGPLAQITNPASISWAPEGLDLGVAFVRSDVDFESSGTYGPGVEGRAGDRFRNHVDAATDLKHFPFPDNNSFAPMLATIHRLEDSEIHLGALRLADLSLGLSFHALGGNAARFRVDHPTLGPGTLARANTAVLQATATLSYRVCDWLSLGATVQGVGARSRLDTVVTFPTSQVVTGDFADFLEALGLDESSAFASFTHDGIELGMGGRFGLSVRPTSWLRLAAAWQTSREVDFDGRAKVDFGPQIDEARALILLPPDVVDALLRSFGIDPELGFVQHYDATIPLKLPEQLDVGVAIRPVPPLLLEVDYSWIRWSRAFRDFEVLFRNGTNPNLNLLAGGPDVDFVQPLRWKDQHVVRVGASLRVHDRVTLRAGYSWSSQPIRGNFHVLTTPSAAFHRVTGGVSVALSERVELSLSLARSFSRRIQVRQSEISSFQSDSEQRTSQVVGQLSLGVRF